jgi:hypothetical protein
MGLDLMPCRFERTTTLRIAIREGSTPLPNDHLGANTAPLPWGAIAQLGERLNGIQEVRGSIPLGSTIVMILNTCKI